ncbi:HD domain-containing phosphohydrolase [Halocella sp. SP3-1]|uniref:HD domain-containing phosphohydrolase n=1 Tax=Halocella sp. SP3-1 TaxID=2382161 RepID=UPI000F75B18C|nr:HD domain-containing phosphohydrolase [Halocella sp. SP3-1]AZO96033.1 HD domain-containing protein [Halocella sp. SP3-1]
MNSFSFRLKNLRKEKNISQEKLANDLGYSRSTIANYEQNTRLPSADVLTRIADYFEVSLDYLLGRSNIRLSLKDYLTHNTPSILLFIDFESGKIIEHSPAALSYYGYTREQFLNKTIFDLHTHPRGEIKILIDEAHNKKQQVFYSKHRLANGEIRDVKITITSLTINSKIIITFLIQDITDFRKENIFTNILDSLLLTLGKTNLYKTPYKKNHSEHVAALAYEIGKLLSLPAYRLNALKIAALLHDIGELNIPYDILNKPSGLTENEFNLIKEHPQFSYDIINNIPFEQPVAKIVLQHHERIDGSGYPRGLSNSNILIEAKILAVADVVDAITSDRPYRQALGIDYALNELKRNSRIKYDPDVVEACLKLFKNKLFTFKNKKLK